MDIKESSLVKSNPLSNNHNDFKQWWKDYQHKIDNQVKRCYSLQELKNYIINLTMSDSLKSDLGKQIIEYINELKAEEGKALSVIINTSYSNTP